jgi:hypothetical protein
MLIISAAKPTFPIHRDWSPKKRSCRQGQAAIAYRSPRLRSPNPADIPKEAPGKGSRHTVQVPNRSIQEPPGLGLNYSVLLQLYRRPNTQHIQNQNQPRNPHPPEHTAPMPRFLSTPILFVVRHFEIHRDCRRRRLPRHSRFWASAGQEIQTSSTFQISDFKFAMPSLHAPNVGDVPLQRKSHGTITGAQKTERQVNGFYALRLNDALLNQLRRRPRAQHIQNQHQATNPHPPKHPTSMPRLLSTLFLSFLYHFRILYMKSEIGLDISPHPWDHPSRNAHTRSVRHPLGRSGLR